MAAFLQYLAAERGASPHTIRSYRADLHDCVGFLERRGLGTLVDADARVVRGYLADLHDRGLARTSIARRLATLRSFFRFLIRRGRVRVNPGARGAHAEPARPAPGAPADRPEPRRSSAQPPGDEVADRRDRAILEVLYATGVRVAELAGPRRGGRRPPARAACGSSARAGKERIVPLGSKAVEALRAYLGGREGARGPLFRNARGGRLTVRSLHRIVRARARAAGLAGRVTPAHAAPHLRDPPPGRRRGPPPDPGAPRARPAGDDPALHARERGPADEGLRRGPPAGEGLMDAADVPRDDGRRRPAPRTGGDGRRRAGEPRRRRS